MLALTRHEGDSLIIDHQIEVKIVRVQGGKVTIGIEAPPEVLVLRKELTEDDERRAA